MKNWPIFITLIITIKTTSCIQIIKPNPEGIIDEVRSFCSRKSLQDAKKSCNNWVSNQKHSLGNRLLTSTCETYIPSEKYCQYPIAGQIRYDIKIAK